MAQKALQYLLTALLVVSLNFLLPRLMPGNPLADLDNPQGLPMPLSKEQKDKMRQYYGLDKPLGQQYVEYLRGLWRGDWGWSIVYNAPVKAALLGRLKWTVLLVGSSTVIYVLLGIVLGAFSAWKRGSSIDRSLLITTLSFSSFPSFFLAMLLIIGLGVKLQWFPLGGAQSPILLQAPWPVRMLDMLKHLAMPSLALILTNVGDIYYITRNTTVQVLGDLYINTARAKGLSNRLMLFHHALPNALLPIVSVVAIRLGFTVMGAMMVEATFAYPGMGSAILDASVSRDYPLLQGAFLLIMISVMAFNLLADGLYAILDPRVRQR